MTPANNDDYHYSTYGKAAHITEYNKVSATVPQAYLQIDHSRSTTQLYHSAIVIYCFIINSLSEIAVLQDNKY